MRRDPAADRYLVALGLAVSAARERRGITQEDLGFAAELDRTYISGVERGIRNPSVRSLLRLAKALGTTPGGLFREAERALGR